MADTPDTIDELMENTNNHPFAKLYFEIVDTPFQFDTIWHYTNASGLMGIIKPNTETPIRFWFTRSDCLNDYSEGEEIDTIFHDLCLQCLNDTVINQTFYKITQTVNATKARAKSRLELQEGTNELSVIVAMEKWIAYICCFSYSTDSLDMWRYYSKNSGGYGIKLNTFNADEQLNLMQEDPSGDSINFKYFKVIYDIDEKKELIRSIIEKAYQAFLQEMSKGNKVDAAIKAHYFLQYVLSTFQYRFKNACFTNEQEYRCVCLIKSDSKWAKEKLPVHYRSQNGTLVPYIEIAFKKENAFISEVMVSPFVKDKSAEDTLQDYLRYCGLSDCKVTKSMLPVRF